MMPRIPGTVPTFLQGSPLPQYVIDEIQRIEESISDRHSAWGHERERPSWVTAASAINLLMEVEATPGWVGGHRL